MPTTIYFDAINLNAITDLEATVNAKATGSGTASGTNTGDQTSVSGNAGTATALQTARTINGTSFDGTTNITLGTASVTLAQMADMATSALIYRKTAATGVPEVNTLATLKTDLLLTGTNSGDQTSIVGITGTIAQFNTALTDGDLATGGGTATGTNTGDQVISDATITTSDITTNDASTSKHGFMMKYPGGTANFLRADGTFAAPTAAAADPSYSPGSFTVATETARAVFNHMKLSGTQRATVTGTARLRMSN